MHPPCRLTLRPQTLPSCGRRHSCNPHATHMIYAHPMQADTAPSDPTQQWQEELGARIYVAGAVGFSLALALGLICLLTMVRANIWI